MLIVVGLLLVHLTALAYSAILYENEKPFRPHFRRRDGSGQYPSEYDLNFPENAAGELAIMFFGRTGSGKSRTIEQILHLPDGFISGSRLINRLDRSFTELPGSYYRRGFAGQQNGADVTICCGDSVGFGDDTRAGRRHVLASINDLVSSAQIHALPVKRIYFIIAVDTRADLLGLSGNLSLLKTALGSEAAAQIRFVVNRCDTIGHFTNYFFDNLSCSVRDAYYKVFPEQGRTGHVPELLFISNEECLGQLLDDIVEVYDHPSIQFPPQNHPNIYSYLPKIIPLLVQRIGVIQSDLAAPRCELNRSRAMENHYRMNVPRHYALADLERQRNDVRLKENRVNQLTRDLWVTETSHQICLATREQIDGLVGGPRGAVWNPAILESAADLICEAVRQLLPIQPDIPDAAPIGVLSNELRSRIVALWNTPTTE